ncbi:alpha/beta hydrolase [Nocardioides albus]|uniref:Pimeloyl-ACP methyl ester carboxylesterase n=1 Tax=Nocardioides albus TaxID=1841 RepID=A0A7W5FBE1_9ACTN|nr:alpha/beta hydrolase [Nocardioides albus]MBB3092125.1 pimeloyl-ACP methyl ester carboxylesterase [Nocardioides albus]GGU45822.1 alpha/beta hydrolase [Nocardioides albus]
MKRILVPLTVAAASLAAALIPGVSVADPASTQTRSPDTIAWGKCPAEISPVPIPKGMQCGTLKVPLDYSEPDGRKIDIAISRLASTKPDERRGILVTNPGGPAAGESYPAMLVATGLPQSVRDSYDVIGFDPRGIGRSTPVTCDLTPEQQLTGNIPPYALDAADVTERAAQSKQIAQQCATSETAWMLPHVSPANTARDMDRIRAALGESKLSYAGASWGTHLGAVYATMFPQRGDRIVLDSNMGPGGWDYASDRLWSQGVEDTFPAFARFAAANHREYDLGTTPRQVRAKFFELAEQLEKKPIQTPDGPFDQVAFRLVNFALLYGPTQLPLLADIWKAVDANQPPPPLPGGGTVTDAENLVSGRYYMICNDSRWPRSVATYQRNVAVDRIRYPLFGAAGANITPCAFWPDPAEPQVRITDRGPANVLMVQNLRDPATPLAGAREMRKTLGQRATMVTADQSGHGVYPGGRNRCANHAVTRYLTTGERPTRDYHCSADAAPR